MSALKKIEERHSLDNGACAGYYCQPNPEALDEIREGARWGMAHDRIVGRAERTLEEVAGEA